MGGKLSPHATHITDIWHAREHLHDLAAHLAFITPDPAGWLEARSAELDTKGDYFEHNAHRMRYQHFRELGMFTGSGHIEAGSRGIVVQRAKQSGMHWTTSGVAAIIALRCQHASGRWDELWTAQTPSPATLQPAI